MERREKKNEKGRGKKTHMFDGQKHFLPEEKEHESKWV